MATDSTAKTSDFLDVASTRRVSRAFTTEEYGDAVLRALLGVANHAPSAANAAPWEFIVIDDEEYQRELSLIYSDETKEYKHFLDPTFWGAGNSREFIDTPATVLIAGDRRYQHWWPEAVDGYRRRLYHINMATAGISLHLAAATVGLATTWVTTRGPTQQRLRELTGMPDWFHVGTAAPLGYPELDRTKDNKDRFPLADKVHAESFDRQAVPTYEEIMARKEAARQSVYHPEGDSPPLEQIWGNTALSLDGFGDLVASWRSTTAFRDGPVGDDVLETVMEAGRQAPSAGNAQPWEFVVLRDTETRSTAAGAVAADLEYKATVDPSFDPGVEQDLVGGRPQAFDDAPVTLVVAGNRHLENLWPNVPDGSQEKLFHHSMTACITSMLYAATEAGLATTWYVPAAAGQRRLRAAFDLPSWFEVEGVIALGRAADEGAGRRPAAAPLDEKIHRNDVDVDRLPSTDALIAAGP